MKTILFLLLSFSALAGPQSFTTTPAPDSIAVVNGLYYNVTKGFYQGYVPIPISDQAGLSVKRKVVAVDFNRAPDFHLIIKLTIDFFNADSTHFLTSALEAETESVKRENLRKQFQPVYITLTTRDS